MAKGETILLDMDNAADKRQLMAKLYCLRGLHEITVKRRRKVRTNPQNRYYWGFVVRPLAQELTEQWGEPVTEDKAHAILKAMFLTEDTRVVNKETGEMIPVTITRSTTTLDTLEMTEYIETCRNWMQDFLNVTTVDPGSYGE